MISKCDLYLEYPLISGRLGIISFFDKKFIFDKDRSYQGYLNIALPRLRLVSVITSLREENYYTAYNIPINYRDNIIEGKYITENEAFFIASNHINVCEQYLCSSNRYITPMVWNFKILEKDKDNAKNKIGARILIDKLDGHIWSDDEYYTYLYDYNNILA